MAGGEKTRSIRVKYFNPNERRQEHEGRGNSAAVQGTKRNSFNRNRAAVRRPVRHHRPKYPAEQAGRRRMCERYMAPRMEQYPAGGAEKPGGLPGAHHPQCGAEPAAKTEPLETGRRRNDADLGGAGRDAARPGHPGAALGAQGHSGSAGALFAGADPGGTDTVPPAVLVGGAGKNGGCTQRHFPAAGQEHTGAAAARPAQRAGKEEITL